MKIVFLSLVATISLAFLLSMSPGQSTAEKSEPTLPGAREIIQAADYPSLQAALDALPISGGMVVLPPGSFEINAPLRIHTADTCIFGSGTATEIRNMNQEGLPAIIVDHPEAAENRNENRLWRVRLTNFRVTGNEKSGPGIEARYVNELLLDAMSVSYCGSDGVLLDHCYEDPRISSCLFTYNKGVGLNLIGCHDIIVSATQFEENRDALHCIDGFNLTMTGNTIDDHLRHGVVIENTYGSVVSGNMIEECAGTAIIIDRDCYGNTLSSNVIAHNGAGIDIRDGHGLSISANTFTLMKTHAIIVSANSGRLAITGNSFCNSYIGEGSIRRSTDDMEAGGILLAETSDISMSGNQFSSLTGPAITLQGKSQRVVFSSNVLTDVTSEHPGLEGSVVETNLDSAAK
jgi:parallel beta-helix repeat protein